MKKNWPMIAVVILLSVGSLAFRGCNEKQQQDFRSAVKIGAAAAVEVREQVKDLCRAELLKPESCAKAQPRMERIADIAGRLGKFVDAHPKLSADNKAEALALVDDLLRELDSLEADGVIEFKDPENKRKFMLGLALGKSGIRIARAAIEAQPVPVPSPVPE
jgi:hypothetical protein